MLNAATTKHVHPQASIARTYKVTTTRTLILALFHRAVVLPLKRIYFCTNGEPCAGSKSESSAEVYDFLAAVFALAFTSVFA